ncbi:MAG: phosphotransferase [Bacilli bacterium]|nr:phosphotransferase [Bacilli bacterium]
MNIKDIIKNFKIDGEIVSIEANNTGNINRTYMVTVNKDGKDKRYIVQKINTTVFNEPYLLMNNIENVTNYCRNYLEQNGEDIKRGTLSVVRTIDNKNLYRTKDNEYYRMYDFVENAISYDKAENEEMFYNVGKACGHFVRMLDGYPMDELDETIPNFHNTKSRYDDLINSIKKDPVGRAKMVMPEILFVLKRSDQVSQIVDLIDKGEIPLRVTHNDTKINNVLMDKNTNEAICMIDLDTVMPGSALYDFGDAVRSGAAKTIEDDPNLENAGINLDYFKSFTEAYLSETKDILTKTEIDYLAFSCILLTLELAIRFLTDYINGDTYFKCNYENHNLDRVRNQIALVKDMEKNYVNMNNIVRKIAYGKSLTLKKDNK